MLPTYCVHVYIQIYIKTTYLWTDTQDNTKMVASKKENWTSKRPGWEDFLNVNYTEFEIYCIYLLLIQNNTLNNSFKVFY